MFEDWRDLAYRLLKMPPDEIKMEISQMPHSLRALLGSTLDFVRARDPERAETMAQAMGNA